MTLSPLPLNFCFRDKKLCESAFFSKNKYFDFFTVTHPNDIPTDPKNKINIIKDVLVSSKSKFSDKLFNFYEKNANFTIFRKVQIIFNITKKLEYCLIIL